MSIKESVEAARFPVYKSGGYQAAAVDALLSDVITQAEGLEQALADERGKRGALELEVGTLRNDLQAQQERVAELESRLADALATPPAPVENPEDPALRDQIEQLEARLTDALNAAESHDDSALRARIAELETEKQALQRALDEAQENAKADEEHIAAMESYADVVEQNSQALKAERDKIRHDAEEALRILSERLAAAEGRLRSLAARDEHVVVASEPVVEVVAEEPEPVVEPEVVVAAEPEPTPPTPSPVPQPTQVGEEVDPNEDNRPHTHTPSVVTPARAADDDSPKRPRLMRRG